MVKKKNSDENRDWRKTDARILGQILAAQNIIFALPDTAHIAEFYAHALISVPGITSCRVCLGDISAQAGEMESSVCAECEKFRKTAGQKGTIIPANLDFKCKLADQPGMHIIAINSYQHHFGFIVFKIKNATVFDLYQPFISNLANYIAISFENRLQEDLLQNAHDELERRVEERTAELKNANELLLQDINERKRVEKALQEQYSTLHSTIESTNALIFSVDRQYRYTSFNTGHAAVMKAIYGVDIEIGRSLLDCQTVSEDRETAKRNIDRALAGEHLVEMAYSGEEKLSRLYFEISHNPVLAEDGTVIGVVVFAQDITERKRAEEALAKSETKYRVLFEDAGDYILVISLRDINRPVIIDANNATLRRHGYSREELIGKAIWELDAPGYFEKNIKIISQMQKPGDSCIFETMHVRKDGSTFPAEVSARLLKIGDEPPFVISIERDITERKKAEEIKIENLRLEAADKAKSEFLANMSHELRTPLNASIGFSEILKQGMAGELSEKQKHFVDNIITSNQFLLNLINDILDLSKIEAGKIDLVPEKMSVPETIKETLSLIKEKASLHNVILKTEFDPELEFIEADKQRFKQILFNLLSNAVKFSKEGGGTVTVTVKKVGDMAKISVSDTGIGIKEENIGRLFRKFEQLESDIGKKYGGTGLGLAITKQLAELHGGRIWAESSYGKGSTFTFMLPLKEK